VVEHERERELDQRAAGLLGELGQLLGGVELALVLREREVGAASQAAARVGGRAQ
jgi:hypothetical protein